MNAFSKYFIRLCEAIWDDFVEWLSGIWETFFKNIYNNIVAYFRILRENNSGFGFLGWIMFVIAMILFATLIIFIIVRLVYYIRRYVSFRKTEISKEDLKEEIAVLNERIVDAINEKNKILAMKVSQLGVNGGGNDYGDYGDKSSQSTTQSAGNSRFPKLSTVDAKYARIKMQFVMKEEDKITLPEIVNNFINYSCSKLHLYYEPKTIRLFFAGMATTKVLILEGISGTGKTSLPYAMSKFFNNNASIISVQPSWRDRAELLGYLNEFTKKFNETDFLKCLYETLYRKDINFIVLDEMNLARIEYYFAEFLSIMEMPDKNEWKIDLVPNVADDDPKLLVNGKLIIPQNVWFVGTANKDDSTFTITDKVYDRAATIEFGAKGEPFKAEDTDPMTCSYEYLDSLFEQSKGEHPISVALLDKLAKLDDYLINNFKLAFGNRIMKQIDTFVPVYVGCGGNENEALDYILARKVLRKFEALNITFMKDELDALANEIGKLFGKNSFTESIKYIRELQRMV